MAAKCAVILARMGGPGGSFAPVDMTAGWALVDLPVGTTTDFASVPRWAWWFAPPASGRHRLAALIHDRLYQTMANATGGGRRDFPCRDAARAGAGLARLG